MHKTKSKLALKCLIYRVPHFPVFFSYGDSEKGLLQDNKSYFWVQIKLEKGGTTFFNYSHLKEEKTTPSHGLTVNTAISRPDIKQP